MSFNEKLRRLVYGTSRPAGVTNPLKDLPAGFTGMTWGGTGFDEPPEVPVVLDDAALPWELRDGETEERGSVGWQNGKTNGTASGGVKTEGSGSGRGSV